MQLARSKKVTQHMQALSDLHADCSIIDAVIPMFAGLPSACGAWERAPVDSTPPPTRLSLVACSGFEGKAQVAGVLCIIQKYYFLQ